MECMNRNKSLLKSHIRTILIFSFLLFINLTPAFAQSWFVCLSSFKNEKNAENLMKELFLQGIDVCLDEHTDENGTLYRVLLYEPFKNRNDARKRCKEISENEVITKSGLSDLWICTGTPKLKAARRVVDPQPQSELQPEPQPLNQPQPLSEPEFQPQEQPAQVSEPIVLDKNDDKIPLSEEKPYSVKVRSYKEEVKAQNDKKRLEEKDIEAYVLKTYDEDSYFNFDLHAGAFKTPEESEKLQEKLEEMGIDDTELSDFKNLKDNIQLYEEVIQNEKVIYETGNDEIPDLFSDSVLKCIREFPINDDFEIEKIAIFDLEQIYDDTILDDAEVEYNVVEDLASVFPEVQAASSAIYKDELFGSELEILIAAGEKNCFSEIESYMEESEKLELAYNEGIFSCIFTEKDDEFFLMGVNEDYSMFILLGGENFTEEQIVGFLNNINNDSSLLIYPQLRKSLLVLPKENPEIDRDFMFFVLSKVDKSYAESRGYVDWAIPIVGHWKAEAHFDYYGDQLSVAFFDMDYDYTAKKVHQMFMDSKLIVNDYSHPDELKHTRGWYVDNLNGKEVSFSTKSYIIAVDSTYDSSITEEELIEFGDDLQIWDLY